MIIPKQSNQCIVKAGDIILTHSKFGLFSFIINGTDYFLYKIKALAKSILQSSEDAATPPFIKIDHIARICNIYQTQFNKQMIDLYETVAINKQYPFFSFKRWRGGTIKTTMFLHELHQHYHGKKIYLKQLKQPLNEIQIVNMCSDLESQVDKTKKGLTRYTWKYVFLSPFDIFFSVKKRPNKDTIKHINYCQMLIKKNNIAIGLEVELSQKNEILESPLQEIDKPFYNKDIIEIIK
jgi:hypothetical protein